VALVAALRARWLQSPYVKHTWLLHRWHVGGYRRVAGLLRLRPMSRRYVGLALVAVGALFMSLAFLGHGLGVSGEVPGAFGILLVVVGAFVAF
jgi:hypothetical protein